MHNGVKERAVDYPSAAHSSYIQKKDVILIMLKQGIYKAENNDSIWDSYSVKMHVKETDKAYIFQLIDLDTLYSAAHIEMMFKRSKRFVLKKNRGGHAMRIWSDGDFTIYPYQAGIPYYFKLVEAGAQ